MRKVKNEMINNSEMLLTKLKLSKWNHHLSFYSKEFSIQEFKLKIYILIVMDKSIHDESLSQPLQIKNEN